MTIVYTNHLFGCGQTVNAAIRLYNGYNLSDADYELLLAIFKEENDAVLKVGSVAKVPILVKDEIVKEVVEEIPVPIEEEPKKAPFSFMSL